MLHPAHQEYEMCWDPRPFNSVTFPTKGLLGPFVQHQLELVSPSFSPLTFLSGLWLLPFLLQPQASVLGNQMSLRLRALWPIFLHTDVGESLWLLESLDLDLRVTTNRPACCATSLVLAEFLECYHSGLRTYFSTSVMENVSKLTQLSPNIPQISIHTATYQHSISQYFMGPL